MRQLEEELVEKGALEDPACAEASAEMSEPNAGREEMVVEEGGGAGGEEGGADGRKRRRLATLKEHRSRRLGRWTSVRPSG